MQRKHLLPVFLLGGVLAPGCLLETDGIKGKVWAIEANPAEGHRKDNGQQVPILTDLNVYVRGFLCMCPSTHELYSDGVAGQLAPGSQDEQVYLALLSLNRDAASNNCIAKAADIGSELGTVILFDNPSDVSCTDASDDETPFLLGDCLRKGDSCPDDTEPLLNGTEGLPDPTGGSSGDTGGTTVETADVTGSDSSGGSGDDGGLHVYGLDAWTDVILESSPNYYKVDIDFAEGLLADLSVLSDDYIGVGLGTSSLSHRGFEFETVGANSIADAVEFEAGDIVWELNGEALQNMDDMLDAFEAYSGEDTFVVKLDRGGSTVTKTFVLVDLNTYP